MDWLSNKGSIGQMFSRVSGKYDFLNLVLSFGMDRKWRRLLVDIARCRAQDRVLDLCTGTGDIAVEFARRAAGVTGVDFSAEMLRNASEKAGRSDFPGRIRLVRADALRLPFGDSSFDIVSVGFGLRNLLDHRKGLIEMTRVLRPGGRLLILEMTAPDRSLFGRLYRFYLRHALPRIARLFGDRTDGYAYLSASVRSFAGAGEVAHWLRSCGLADVSARKVSLGIAYIYNGRKPG